MKHMMMNICRISEKQYDAVCSVLNHIKEYACHLMKVGHKCNKAAKVIRTATGYFTIAHTPHIGLERNMMKQGSRTRPFRKDLGRFNSLWLNPFIHINSCTNDKLQWFVTDMWKPAHILCQCGACIQQLNKKHSLTLIISYIQWYWCCVYLEDIHKLFV